MFHNVLQIKYILLLIILFHLHFSSIYFFNVSNLLDYVPEHEKQERSANMPQDLFSRYHLALSDGMRNHEKVSFRRYFSTHTAYFDIRVNSICNSSNDKCNGIVVC